MTQNEIEQQICRRTGESLQTIRQMGFSPLFTEFPIEERQNPLTVDWDLENLTRNRRGVL